MKEKGIVNKGTELIQIVVFKLNGQSYAFDISSIKEVVLRGEISEMPKSHNYVMGVSNIRGNILVIIDLELKFNLKEEIPEELSKYIIVIEHEEHRLGILLDNVPTTLAIDKSNLDSSEDVLDSSNVEETFVEGIIKYNDEMIIKVDAVSMMKHDDITEVMMK